MLGVKLQRTSYSRKDPDSLERLRKAVEDWDNKSGPLFNHLESGMALPMKDYAASVGIPYQTFHREMQHSPHGSATVISKYLASV